MSKNELTLESMVERFGNDDPSKSVYLNPVEFEQYVRAINGDPFLTSFFMGITIEERREQVEKILDEGKGVSWRGRDVIRAEEA